jgi:hypothetical protein
MGKIKKAPSLSNGKNINFFEKIFKKILKNFRTHKHPRITNFPLFSHSLLHQTLQNNPQQKNKTTL